MGLDMYLYEKVYLPNWNHMPQETRSPAQHAATTAGLTPTKETTHVYVEAVVAYWRKANAIHKWFIDNCANGIDNDAEMIYVEPDQLVTLMDLAQQVIADPSLALQLLPPQDGFFFGSTDIDQRYFDDLKSTVAQIDTVLKNKNPDSDFYYYASW